MTEDLGRHAPRITGLVRDAGILAGVLLGLSVINLGRLDAWAVAGAVATFVFVAAWRFGEWYFVVAVRSELVRRGFGMIVNPCAAMAPLLTFFYALFGTVPALFVVMTLFFGLIFFALELVPFTEELGKKK